MAAAPLVAEPGRLGPGLPWWLPASIGGRAEGLRLPRCVAKGWQLPGSAHGREACGGESSVIEGRPGASSTACRLRAVVEDRFC